VSGWRRLGLTASWLLGAVAYVLLLAAVPRPALGLGTVEVGVTAGSDSFLERSAFLRVEPWDFLAADVEAAFADADGTDLTEYYRFGAALRTPAGVDVGGGYSLSPAADGVKSESGFGELKYAFTALPDRWEWASAVSLAYEKQTFSFRLPAGWADLGQKRYGVRWAQTLWGRWVVAGEYATYDYDRDLDQTANRLVLAGLRRPNRNLLFLADRVSSLPDRTWGVSLDAYPQEALRLSVSYSRIEAAVAAFGADENRWGAAISHRFRGGVGVTIGADWYDGPEDDSVYPYLRMACDF